MSKSSTRLTIAIILTVSAMALVGMVAVVGLLLRVVTQSAPALASSGPLAPLDWYVTDLQTGEEIHLEQFYGEVLVLNFWATWCPPCRVEKPALDRLHAAMGEKGVRVLAVSVREQPSVVRRYLQENGYTLPVAISNGMMPEELNVTGLPTTLVINAEGEIVLRRVGAFSGWDSEQMQEQLTRLLPSTGDTSIDS
jgi:thiol-disulfide isomerase/thioredoxin